MYIYLFGFIAEIAIIIKLLNDKYDNEKPKDDEFKIGYKDFFIRKPIYVNFVECPHVLISGLSCQGKSTCADRFLRGKKNITLVNTYDTDFKELNGKRVNGLENIASYLNEKALNKEDKTREFILIDDMLLLCRNKDIEKSLIVLLAEGRHRNKYIIGITQDSAKEVVKFKNLFNIRISFKQVDRTSYATCLGYSPDVATDGKLRKGEFYYYADDIGKGVVYYDRSRFHIINMRNRVVNLRNGE